MAGHIDLPSNIPALLLSKREIFEQLKIVDSDPVATARVLRMESEFRSKIDSHLLGLPDGSSRFSKFCTSPFVLMFYSRQKSYAHVHQIESDLVPAKVFSSMETSAGNMIEKLVLPVYGWEYVESAMGTYKSLLDARRVDLSGDRLVVATLKSGPRTLNDGMVDNIASEVVERARDWAIEFGVKEVDFTYGALYGTRRQSNKKDWHILRKIVEKRPGSAAEIISHKGSWTTAYSTGALKVSATVRNGIEWWELLGGAKHTWLELCCALIRACVVARQPLQTTPPYTIVDLREILDHSFLDPGYNVSLLQRSQFEWLLFLARHFSDGFAD